MRPLAAGVLCASVLLSGCVNLYAGIARYTVEPFYDPDLKAVICCRAQVTSGKNAGSVIAHITKTGDSFTVDLTEQGVNSAASISAATGAVSDVAKAVSDTATAVAPLIKGIP